MKQATCVGQKLSFYGEKLDNEDSLPPDEGCGLIDTADAAYTGHIQDASGLVYAQQRYYDPVIGRFMSTDPVMPHAGDPRYFGRYHYAATTPTAIQTQQAKGFGMQFLSGVQKLGKGPQAQAMVSSMAVLSPML